MNVLFAAFGLFAVALLIHVVVWRVRVPQQQAGTLVVIILIVGIVGFTPLVSLGLQDIGPYEAPDCTVCGDQGFWWPRCGVPHPVFGT